MSEGGGSWMEGDTVCRACGKYVPSGYTLCDECYEGMKE